MLRTLPPFLVITSQIEQTTLFHQPGGHEHGATRDAVRAAPVRDMPAADDSARPARSGVQRRPLHDVSARPELHEPSRCWVQRRPADTADARDAEHDRCACSHGTDERD